jgi:predicted dehydrogenase
MNTQTPHASYKRVLLVGGGAIGEIHVPRVLGLLAPERLSILEVASDRARFLSRKYRKEKRIEILTELPASAGYDLALVCTPPKFHFPYFRDLASRVGAFLIEKPMTITGDEARRIAEAGGNGGPIVFVNLMRRQLASYRLIGQHYRNRTFGPLESVEIHEGSPFGWRAVSKGSFSKELNGGGVLMDTGAHTLDLLLHVFDSFTVREAFMDADPSAVEANCVLKIETDAGVPVVVGLSRNRSLSNRSTFRFAEACLSVGVRENLIEVTDKRGLSYRLLPPDIDPAGEPPTFAQLLDSFYVDRVLGRNNEGVGPAESLHVIEQMERAYAIAQPIRGGF